MERDDVLERIEVQMAHTNQLIEQSRDAFGDLATVLRETSRRNEIVLTELGEAIRVANVATLTELRELRLERGAERLEREAEREVRVAEREAFFRGLDELLRRLPPPEAA